VSHGPLVLVAELRLCGLPRVDRFASAGTPMERSQCLNDRFQHPRPSEPCSGALATETAAGPGRVGRRRLSQPRSSCHGEQPACPWLRARLPRRVAMRPGGASFLDVSEPRFRFVWCHRPGRLATRVGDRDARGRRIALLADDGGFAAINDVAHALGLISVRSFDARRRWSISTNRDAYADRLPLCGWARTSARRRLGPPAVR